MTTSTALPLDRHHHLHWLPLLEVAAAEVFELMLSCELTVPESSTEDELDITSMVGLAGKLCGVLSIRCKHESARIMASRMLGIDPDKADPELADALGEICNMVAGNFKNKIAGLGDGCLLSVPTVITGNDYRLHSTIDSDPLEVRLLFENMPIVISLEIHS